MTKIAVVDTETTWNNVLMSVGIVIADASDYSMKDSRYYVLDPEYKQGGMYSDVIFLNQKEQDVVKSRSEAIKELDGWLKDAGVRQLYAYNANFDKNILTEFSKFKWYDIMRLAAYRQYNRAIPDKAECCGTGRLKRNYGVEQIRRMLSGDFGYCETHNALQDALDELDIMRMLCLSIEAYEVGRLL